MTNQTNTNSIGSVSFLNMFGILVSIVLCVLFIILGGHTLKYIKAFACKIKIIVNRAEDKNVQLKDYNYQGKEPEKRSEAYEQMETIFKNEIKKSRSLQYWNIVKNLIAKYDHILYYPFRDKVAEQYDLLKPKTTFYVLLVICTCCIAWMTTIFLSAILQSSYSNVTLIPIGTFAGLTVAISIISSILNLIATNRLFRIYYLNVKAAFKVDYGHKFLALDQGLKDYEPENSEEEEEIFKHQEMLKNLEIIDPNEEKENQFTQSQMITHRNNREDTQLNSTRKLLGEDMERSDKFNLQPNQQVIHEQQEEENQQEDINNQGPNEGQAEEQLQLPQKKRVKGKAIKDIFDLQVGIEGADDANTEDKYIFVEDKHAIGDMDLLDNEAMKGENRSNLTTFVTLFMIIAIASAVCCYLNYTFQTLLAQAVFIMFVCSFFGDILISRPLILMLLGLLKFCRARKRGYQRIQYKTPEEIRQVFNKAIKDMFTNRKKVKEQEQNKKISGDTQRLMLPKTLGKDDNFGNKSSDRFMDGDNITQNGYERHDTSMKQPLDFEDGKEDEYAQEVNNKQDDDFDGGRVPPLDLKTGFHPTEYARPQIEDEQKKNITQPFEQTQTLSYNTHTHIPLLSNLTKAIKEKENEKFQDLMEKKQLTNDLVDYNLLLLRKIYDAYEDRAEKVLKNFRSDRNGVLRKRYMVPILNPNYDYEKLLQEMQAAGKVAKDKEEEESVHLDGVTVCEDFERQLMEAIIQEAADDLVQKKVDRIKIDKFGNPIDEDKLKDGFTKACPQPNFGYIEHEIEENVEEDDEAARKRRLLEMLRDKLARGEELSEEELAMLEQLENERLQELEKMIQEFMKRGYNNLSDEEKLQVIGLQKEKYGILLGQVKRKKNKTKDDLQKIKEYEDELKRLELEELRLKEKLHGLTEEEMARLNQLEDERLAELMKRIAELQNKGWDNLSNDEKFELFRLQKEAILIQLDKLKRKKPPLSKEDLQRLKDLEDEYRRIEYEELLLKQKLGMNLTDAEKKRLQELTDFFNEEERKRREAEEDELRKRELGELEELRRKLLAGEITEDELRRLRELEEKYGLEHIKNPFEEQIQLNEEFDDNMEDDLMNSRITEQDNFSELPPVQVMNNIMSKPQSPDKNLNGIDEQSEEQPITDRSQLKNLQQNEDGIGQGSPFQNQDPNSQDPNMLLMMNQQDPNQRLNDEDDEENKNQDNHRNQNQDGLTEDQIQQQLLQQQLLQQQQLDQQLLEQQQQDQLLKQQQQLTEQERLAQEKRDQEEMLRKQKEEEERLKEIERLKQQQELDAQLNQQNTSQQDFNNLVDQNKFLDDDLAFGHDDLEFGQITAPPGANGEESIYSHKTTTILDEEKVSFMHIEHLPNQDNGSDDSFSEQDMVYYNKDDLTNYSKGLGLNKVKARPSPGQNYFSENDLHEIKEGELLDNDSVSNRSGRSLDPHGRQRAGYGRGRLSHNDLDIESHEDLIEGRVKVDAWNLNYRGKKKKHRKKKVTDNQKKKMHDLQNIYGVDAKTLAGLSKGRLPRQLLASGKLKGDDGGNDPNSRMMMSDNSFRSTQNTFHNKLSTPGGNRMKQSINDAQSNMFSFHGGFGTKTGWNNTAMKKGPIDSRDFNGSQFDQQKSTTKKFPNGMTKLTQTQQNFANNQGQKSGYNNIPGHLEEESKSVNSGSRGGSLNRQFKANAGQNLKNKGKGKKGTGKGQKKNKNPLKNGNFDGVDSHSESDEAVDDKGAMFQKRAGPYNFNGTQGFGGNNTNQDDLNHSESEEGNNQDIPNFDGNDFMFKKRGGPDFGESGMNKKSQNKAGKNKGNNNRAGRGNGFRGSGSELSIEDLEAQSVSGKKNRRNPKNTNKKAGAKNKRQGSAEREDSEEENLGGIVNFQKRNQRDEYDGSDLERMGRSGDFQGSGYDRSKSNNRKQNSNSKPPLSNRKGNNNNQRTGIHQGLNNSNNQFGDSNGFNGKGQKFRNGYSDVSDNERNLRGSYYSNASDNDAFGNSNKKNLLDLNNIGRLNRNSDQDLLGYGYGNKNGNRGGAHGNYRGHGNGMNANDSDDGDDYIVGPESNHSSIRKRPIGGQNRGSQDDEQERYLLLQRERQIIQDIESQDGDGGNNRLAKKRKIRKAAQSQNPKDSYAQRVQQMQNERLKKKQREAEAALFANDDDLEMGKAKIKKKKIKKDWVKKEINYWLDYDSPYAEYLVARFREWSPNPNVMRVKKLNYQQFQGPSAGSQRKGVPSQNKYNEVMNVYAKGDGRQGSNHSRSRSKGRGESAMNQSFQKVGSKNNAQSKSQIKQQQNVNTLFVNDYEEDEP